MNEQTLAEHGYKEFPKSPFCPEYASKAYQKCVRNAFGDKLYFINIYWYRDLDSYSATTKFHYTNRKRDEFMDIVINCVNDIKWLELHLHNIWRSTAADIYERRDEE